MKIRGAGKKAEKIETPMSAMIDVVFQLLIFFLLTLKIIEPEGDFNINMPIGAPSQASADPLLPDIKVRLTAGEEGRLNSLQLGNRNLFDGNVEASFQRLNMEILQIIGTPGDPATKDIEVELDPDYDLNYEYIIRAIGACTGRMVVREDGTKGLVRYIEKIKFAPPRRPPPGV